MLKCTVCPGEGSEGIAMILKLFLILLISFWVSSAVGKGGMVATSVCLSIFSKPGPGSTATLMLVISAFPGVVFMAMELLPSPEIDEFSVPLIYHLKVVEASRKLLGTIVTTAVSPAKIGRGSVIMVKEGMVWALTFCNNNRPSIQAVKKKIRLRGLINIKHQRIANFIRIYEYIFVNSKQIRNSLILFYTALAKPVLARAYAEYSIRTVTTIASVQAGRAFKIGINSIPNAQVIINKGFLSIDSPPPDLRVLPHLAEKPKLIPFIFNHKKKVPQANISIIILITIPRTGIRLKRNWPPSNVNAASTINMPSTGLIRGLAPWRLRSSASAN